MAISKALLKNQELLDLMKEANDSLEGVIAAELRATEAAIDCGMALLAAHDLVPHGRWLKFLKDAFTGSERTAQRYMRIARGISEGTIVLDGNETIQDLEFDLSGMEQEAEAPEPTATEPATIEETSPIEDDKGEPTEAPEPRKSHPAKLESDRQKRAKVKRDQQPALDLDAARKAIALAMSHVEGKRKAMVALQLQQVIDRCKVEPERDECEGDHFDDTDQSCGCGCLPFATGACGNVLPNVTYGVGSKS